MEIELSDHFDRMNKVVAELLKGNNPTQIASLTGFKRSDVVELIDEWKTVVYNDTSSKERAKEAISGADQHYSMLIKEAWKTVEDADQAGQLNVKANALKLISDIETKRIIQLIGNKNDITKFFPKNVQNKTLFFFHTENKSNFFFQKC